MIVLLIKHLFIYLFIHFLFFHLLILFFVDVINSDNIKQIKQSMCSMTDFETIAAL